MSFRKRPYAEMSPIVSIFNILSIISILNVFILVATPNSMANESKEIKTATKPQVDATLGGADLSSGLRRRGQKCFRYASITASYASAVASGLASALCFYSSINMGGEAIKEFSKTGKIVCDNYSYCPDYKYCHKEDGHPLVFLSVALCCGMCGVKLLELASKLSELGDPKEHQD